MLKYIKLNGVSFEDSQLEKVTLTEEGKKLGSIPNWQMLSDIERTQIPATSLVGQKISLNRVTGKMMLGQRSGGELPELVTVAGNDYYNTTGKFLTFDPDTNINPNEWTVYSVFVPTTVGASGNSFLWTGAGTSFDTEELSLAISYSQVSGTLFLRSYGYESNAGPSRLTASNVLSLDGNTPTLVIASFSIERGVTLRVNGVEYRNTTDKRPLNAKLNSGEYRCYRNFNGLQGPCGMLSIDLTKTENTQHLKSLEDFMKNKYSIPV